MKDKFESIRRCYAILVAAELGAPPSWEGPASGADLRGRTEYLALSLGVLPRHQRDHLEIVAKGISMAFPDESLVNIARLKAVASAELSKLSDSCSVDSCSVDSCSVDSCSVDSCSTRIDGPHRVGANRPHHAGVNQLHTAMDVWRKQLGDRYQCGFHRSEDCVGSDPGSGQARDQESPLRRLYYQPAMNADPKAVPLLVTLTALLDGADNPCVLVAGPGEGKTFAIDRLIEAMLGDVSSSLELPVLIDGSAYAAALSKDNSITPLEFFFGSLGIQDLSAAQAAAAFREFQPDPLQPSRPQPSRPQSSRPQPSRLRRMFIIDQWEEIPESLRCLASRHVQRDSHGHLALIASRDQGREWLGGHGQAYHCFRMASISHHNAVCQARRIIGAHLSVVDSNREAVENVAQLVVGTPELRSLSKNPYWMTQLCTVLAPTGLSNSKMLVPGPALIPCVAEKLLALERRRLNRTQPIGQRLTLAHLQSLGQIAFHQLVSPDVSRYPISKTASLNNGVQIDREYSFSQYECDVATERLGIQSEPIFRSRLVSRVDSDLDEFQFVDPLFQSYFAAQHLIEMVQPAAQLDFFNQAMRCPRLLDVVCNAVAFDPGLKAMCRDGLAEWIGQSDHFGLISERAARVATAARYSADDLDGPVPEIRRRLWDAIQSPIRHCVTKRFVPTLARLDPQFLINKLRAQNRADSPLFSSVCEYVPPVIANKLRPNEIKSMSSRQSSMPQRPCADPLSSVHENVSIENIETNLRRIAGLRPDHPEVPKHLSALVGQPISEKVDVVVQVARCPQADCIVRSLALLVLADSPLSVDHDAIEDLLRVNADLPDVTALLRLARRQNFKIEDRFFENRLALDSPLEEKKQVIEGFLSNALDDTVDSLPKVSSWISRRILLAVDRRDIGFLDIICQCITTQSCREVIQWLDRGVEERATEVLVGFINHPKEISVELVGIVARLVRFRTHESDSIHLLQALEQALSCSRSKRSCAKVAQYESLSRELAIALVDREPAALMDRNWDHPIIQDVLAETACERDWLLYRDRIINADGFVIAKNSNDPLAHLRFSTPEIVQEIARELSPRQRNDFLGYWYVVSEGDNDYAATDRETVHQAMCEILVSDINTPLSERLTMCYRNESPPKFSTWKKNLSRVVDRCANRPDWMAHLQKIGLSKQRKNRRAPW